MKPAVLSFNFTVIVPAVDNEWKTRFETQQEMNNQLEKQVVLLRDKLGQLKIPSRDGKLTAICFNLGRGAEQQTGGELPNSHTL